MTPPQLEDESERAAAPLVQVSRRFALRYGSAALALLVLWVGFGYGLLPRIVRSAYDGTSIGFLNRVITGQAIHPVERYLGLGRWLANLGTLALAGAAVAGFLGWVFRAPLGRAWRSSVRGEPSGTLASSVGTAAFWGMAFGLAEAGSSWIRFRATGFVSIVSNPDAIWMAPLAQGLLFAIGTALIFVALRGGARGFNLRAVALICAALGAYGTLRGLRLGIHPAAVWLLAMGVGVQVSRWTGSGAGLRRAVQRGWIPAAATLVLVAGAIHGGGRLLEARRIGALAPTNGLANVLLVVLDTVRSESLSLYGYARPTTPNLDRRAADDGVVFDRAIATAPWTLPTHGSLFTGRYHYELSTDWEQPLDDTYPTLAEFLGSRGYASGGFVANLMFATRTSGLDRGFGHYADHPMSLAVFATSAWAPRKVFLDVWKYMPSWRDYPDRKYAEDVNEEFLNWLDGVGDRPFFAFLNYFDAHEPYELHDDFMSTFPQQPPRTRDVTAGGAVQELPYETMVEIDSYDSDIAYIDHQLESLLNELDRRGTLENTLVIVTSDHGEHLGDRGLRSHGNSLYTQLVRVPMVVFMEGRVPAGTRIEETISLRDVPATIVEMLGLGESPFPGSSFARLWSADAGSRDESLALSEVSRSPFGGIPQGPVAAGAMKSVIRGSLHYIRNGDGSEELYDIANDPRELRDLSETDIGRAELAGLRRLVDPVLAADTLPRPDRPR